MLTLTSGGVAVVVDPASGGRLASWCVDDVELLAWVDASPVAHGMYPMAPWAGRLTDDTLVVDGSAWRMPITHEGRALHGTVLDAPMAIVEEGVDHLTLECALTDPWPWAGTVRSTWRVRPSGLEAVLEVRSERDAFPAVAGWHPWLRRDLGVGGALQWSFPDEPIWRIAERGEGHALTGRLTSVTAQDGPFDDAFVVTSRRVRLEWSEALSVDVTSSHDWFVVYDQRAEAVCIEPQSGPPGGVNASTLAPVRMVTPQEPLRLHTSWGLTRLP